MPIFAGLILKRITKVRKMNLIQPEKQKLSNASFPHVESCFFCSLIFSDIAQKFEQLKIFIFSLLLLILTVMIIVVIAQIIKKQKGRKTLKGKILIMDDEEIIRTLAVNLLSHLGYAAVTAVNGEQAVELFQQAKNSNKSFDVVILDLTIYDGMGGLKTIEKLKAIDPNVQTIISSGYDAELELSEYGKYGFDGVLSKPYEFEQLKEILEKLLKK